MYRDIVVQSVRSKAVAALLLLVSGCQIPNGRLCIYDYGSQLFYKSGRDSRFVIQNDILFLIVESSRQKNFQNVIYEPYPITDEFMYVAGKVPLGHHELGELYYMLNNGAASYKIDIHLARVTTIDRDKKIINISGKVGSRMMTLYVEGQPEENIQTFINYVNELICNAGTSTGTSTSTSGPS